MNHFIIIYPSPICLLTQHPISPFLFLVTYYICIYIYLFFEKEPTNHLDMQGIIQLRGLIQTVTHRQPTVLVLVSHDIDLINDVATDIIHMSNQTLTYYKGNYNDYTLQKNEKNIHQLRMATTLQKQRNSMIKTIDTMHKQSQSSSSSSSIHHSNSKISKQVNNRKKKLEKHGIEKDENGHRWTSQKAMTGIKVGSINSLDASTRGSGKKNYSELLKNAQLNIAPIPEKEVQFKFRNTTCQWHEPLISALDVGYGFPEDNDNHTDTHTDTHIGKDKDVKIKNMLFDSVDLCVDEKSITCILGENKSGKT
jgi:ATPase subunit of ABC transporter with duplicated ATPase domains